MQSFTSVEPGEVLALLGPNGAGKTTTIRCIMDIILPDAGSMTLAGRELSRPLRDHIGYLPEEKGLYKKMKAEPRLEKVPIIVVTGASEVTGVNTGGLELKVGRLHGFMPLSHTGLARGKKPDKDADAEKPKEKHICGWL